MILLFMTYHFYGLVKVGINWYNNISAAFEAIGYLKNEDNPCVYNTNDDEKDLSINW